MNIPVTDELMDIFRKIESERKSIDEWAEVESDDMFQSESFVGGFDADELAFCFSYFAVGGHEYWFQITLSDIERILAGNSVRISGTPAMR
jgi:hypothetical protein